MFETIKTWGPWLVLAVALAGVAWLARPVPGPSDWPTASPQAEEAMAQRLALAASQAWTDKQPQRAWRAAQALHEAFPSTPQAQRVAPNLARLEEAARAADRQGKWEYAALQSAGWGRLVQASIAAEPLGFSPDTPDSFLVIRSGTQVNQRAVFFIPGIPMPPDCQSSAGCVITVEDGGTSPMRIRPLPDQPGWWVFANFEALVALLKAPRGLSVKVPNSSEPLRFDTSGVDFGQLSIR